MDRKLTFDQFKEDFRRMVEETDWVSMDKQNNKDTARANMSAAHMGMLHSRYAKDGISAALKGRPVVIATCPHCGKRGGNAAMHRWHFASYPQVKQDKPHE